MAINQLKDSMSIISALSDEPNDVDGLSSAELKAKFDTAGTIIKEYINSSLIPEVEAEIVKTVNEITVQSGNMPAGGTEGQALVKASNANFDWDFKTLCGIPAGGARGQVLTKSSGEDHDARFEDLPIAATDWQLVASYTTAGAYEWEAPDLYADGLPYEIGAFVIGGGASGAAARWGFNGTISTFNGASAGGGASGYTRALRMSVTPNSSYPAVVGEGGPPVNTAGQAMATVAGSAGGSSAFNGKTADGGGGGTVLNSGSSPALKRGADGGQGASLHGSIAWFVATSAPGLRIEQAPAMGEVPQSVYAGLSSSVIGAQSSGTNPLMAYNPFDGRRYLGAGGFGAFSYNATTAQQTNMAQTVPTLDDGLRAGAGAVQYGGNADLTAQSATSPGSGGGGAALTMTGNPSLWSIVTSGAGADGAVFIYARRLVR